MQNEAIWALARHLRQCSAHSQQPWICSSLLGALQQATEVQHQQQQHQQQRCWHHAPGWRHNVCAQQHQQQQPQASQAWPHAAFAAGHCLLLQQTTSIRIAVSTSWPTGCSIQAVSNWWPRQLGRHLSTSAAAHGSGRTTTTSAQPDTWLARTLPAAWLPYAQLMRLDKPIGSWLLAWPGLWSIGLAAAPGSLPDPWLTLLFGAGAVLMRGAGCTINDLWDRDIDRRVERTRSRPLAAGTVTPYAALAFLGAQLSASLAILLQLNTYTQVLGVASLGLVATYPLMKRVTWWPQAFLGLAMNYGALMGYAAAAGACEWGVVLPLYLAGVNWTLIYDTIYAHQDKRDDALVGVKSTALLFGDRTKAWACGFALLQGAGMAAAGQAAGCGAPFFAAVAAGSAHIAWQIGSVDLQDGPDCMAKFVSNKWYGAIIYAGVLLDRLLAPA